MEKLAVGSSLTLVYSHEARYSTGIESPHAWSEVSSGHNEAMTLLTRTSAVGALTLLTALVATSCSSSSSPSAVDAASPTTADKQSSNLGVRLCVTNNSAFPANVVFTRKDTGNGGTITRGATTCGEGTFGSGDDVAGGITWDSPGWKTQFSASNPWIGKPTARISERDSADNNKCLGGDFGVHDSRSGENGLVRMTLTRDDDGQWKEFTLRIDPSDRPAPEGRRHDLSDTVSCPGGTREHVLKARIGGT